MKKLIAVAAMTFASGSALACGCEPGSLEFEDTFFRYCDSARAQYETDRALAQRAGDQEVTARGGEREEPRAAEALVAEADAR